MTSLLAQSSDRLVDLLDLAFHEMNDSDWLQYGHHNCCHPMDQKDMRYRMTIVFHIRPYRQGCRRVCKRLRHLDSLVYENHVYIEDVPKFHLFDLFERRLGFEFELNQNRLKLKVSFGPKLVIFGQKMVVLVRNWSLGPKMVKIMGASIVRLI